MIYLLAELNDLQESLIAYFVIMVIVGFILILVDKRRWKAHTERSAWMMTHRGARKKIVESDENGEQPSEDQEGAETKKKEKKKVKSKDNPDDFEYEGRIKLGAFLAVGVLFGGVGELLGMIFLRHKWYNAGFRVGVPLLALLNIIIGALILYLCSEQGAPESIIVNAAAIVGSGLCLA